MKMLSTEHRLKNLLGLSPQATERTQSTAYGSFIGPSHRALLPHYSSSSSPTMVATYHTINPMAELSISSSPVTSQARTPILRKAKSYAIQSTEESLDHSPRQSRGTANIPCKFYRNDACTAGANCPFLHSSNPDHASTTVCKYYLKGSCKFGNKCALSHSFLTTSPNIYGSPMSSRMMYRGASTESSLNFYEWDLACTNESSSLLSDTGSNKEDHRVSDMFPSWKELSPIASNVTTPNIDNRFSSPRTPISQSLNSVEPYSTSSSITDGFSNSAFYVPQGRNYFQHSSPRPAAMTSLEGASYFNDEWSSNNQKSYTSQDIGDDANLARSLDEIFATVSSERTSKTIRRPKQRLSTLPDSQATSYAGLFENLFTEKLSSITSNGYELELTKDILRMRDDRRRASEPSVGLAMRDSQETTDFVQSTDRSRESFERRMDGDIEMTFLMD
ncbi:hypothetical protein K450DRAFT_224039 [Umbelopsis ramanniana AG]|uniref:C3H1-type domain-containing protein n=1 Tax=Umbelopsis ramanniana AG TaxID=1314678 RepID=A0AAD5HHG8_UMBRA|nr:uncharacterized protein K450DRAFT_224039 [Umbelopsis ramanniana AG]KAI8583064.1 hypothetical protein K450DRAFT_224039 [Umbelopsis ramanniana AG]